MDGKRWKRVDELLQAAMHVPAEQQEEFLRQQCGGDGRHLLCWNLPCPKLCHDLGCR
jgi:hypothetical protein